MPRARCPSCPTPSASATRGWASRAYNASVLTAEVETARWFEALLERGRRAEAGAPTGSSSELFGALNRLGKTIDDSPVSPGAGRRAARRWSPTARSAARIAKQVFEIMLETGEAPSKIVEERGLKQTSDTGAIDAGIDEILAANADKVAAVSRRARTRCSASSSARR